MRTAGGVLGIIGSIAGFCVAGLGLLIGVFGVAIGKAATESYNQIQVDPTTSAVVGSQGKEQIAKGVQAASDLGSWGTLIGAASGLLLILCVVGLIGGIMAFFKPPLGAILMVIAGVGGFVLLLPVWVFWSFPGFMLVLGAALAFFGTFSKPAAQLQPAAVPGYYPAPTGYPQPQQGYYPQQQAYPPQHAYPQQPQGFPQPNQYGQSAAPQQNYYPQPTNQAYPTQGGQQQYYPQATTAPQGQQSVPPQDNTKLN